jgi:hypothetical protein
MGDKNLNSVHLEAPRREELRRARARLLGSCGELTRNPVNPINDDPSLDESRTMIQNLENRIPADVECALMDKEGIYPLKVGLNTIGRLPDNDVVLEDPYVSRRHCAVLVHHGNNSELHDVASKNGTYLNGQKLSGPTPLASGDEIRMCDRSLIYVTKTDIHKGPGYAGTLAK